MFLGTKPKTYMNNSNKPDDRQDDSQVFCTSQRIRKDGLIIYTSRNTDISVYSPKTPYSQRKDKLPKGSNGLSRKQKEEIELAVYTFITDYGSLNCKWFVFTFDSSKSDNPTSDEALINLLANFENFYKSIVYILNKLYKKLVCKPYIIVYGLRERTSYARSIPCLDVNILCVIKDEYSDNLFDERTLVDKIYSSASKQAKETIKEEYYAKTIYNTLGNYKKLANYLKDQVDIKILRRFQNSQYALQLPNTYLSIHPSLKETFIDHENKYIGSIPREHREILQEYFSSQVTIEDKKECDYKSVAQINDISPETINKFPSDYEEVYYSEYPDRKTFNNLNEKVNKDNLPVLPCLKATQSSYEPGNEYNVLKDRLRLLLEAFPSEWKINTLTDLAIRRNPKLARSVKEAGGLEQSKDIEVEAAIINGVIDLFLILLR